MTQKSSVPFFLHAHLNPDQTLNSFVADPSNEGTYEAAKRLISSPSLTPYFTLIVGGSNSGKTHLANALGNAMKDANPECRILFATCDDFIGEYVGWVTSSKHAMPFLDFFKKSVDWLIVDDIDALANRKMSIKMFLSVLHAFKETGKKVIVTCERMPDKVFRNDPDILQEFKSCALLNLRNKNPELTHVIIRTEATERRTEIAVGPFYYLDGEVDSALDSIKGIEPIGGMCDGNMSHAKLAALKGREPYRKFYCRHAYDYFPRGRLVYDVAKKTIIIYADKCIRQSEEAKLIVVKALVPDGVKFVWRADAHYKCHKCNPGFIDDPSPFDF